MRNGWLSGSSKDLDLGREIAALRADLGDVVERVSRVSNAASGSIRSGVSSLSETKDRLSGAAQDLVGQGRQWFDVAENEFSRARATVGRNPILGIAIAAGIGFLLGLSTRRS